MPGLKVSIVRQMLRGYQLKVLLLFYYDCRE